MVDYVKELKSEITKKIKDLIFDTHSIIVQNTPVDTGRLRGSIVVEEIPDGYIIGTNVEYAEAVEIGTKPHKIVPKTKQALKFKMGGEVVFSKSVNHPGSVGSHMFLKGVKYFERNLKNLS